MPAKKNVLGEKNFGTGDCNEFARTCGPWHTIKVPATVILCSTTQQTVRHRDREKRRIPRQLRQRRTEGRARQGGLVRGRPETRRQQTGPARASETGNCASCKESAIRAQKAV